MRNINSSAVRASIGAVVAVTVTALTVLLFQSPYTAWGQRTQAPEVIALNAPAVQADVRNA
jgi:hypothetical protein